MESGLNFKINIEPKKVTEHIENIAPDNDLTVDKYDAVYTNQMEEETESQAKELIIQEYDLREAAHPFICIGTLLACALPCVTFVILNSHIEGYLITLASQIGCFLFVKNISGVKLVGLRWALEFKGQKEKWILSSHDSAEKSNYVDSAFFWTSLFWSTLFWILAFLHDFLGFNLLWILLASSCLLLQGLNVYGFYKCRGEHQRKLARLQKEMTKQGLNIVGMILK